MRSADPARCDPSQNDQNADRCFKHWASFKRKNGRPAITFDNWKQIGDAPTVAVEYQKLVGVMRAGEHFLRNAVHHAKSLGTLHSIIQRLESNTVLLATDGGVSEKTRRALDFIDLNDSAPGIKFNEILALSKHPSARGSAETVIESIMAALDPGNCDADEWRLPADECYKHWAKTGMPKKTPAVDFGSWIKNANNPQSAIHYGTFCRVIDAANKFLKQVFADAEERGLMDQLVERLETSIVAFDNREGKLEVKKVANFVSLKRGAEELKKPAVILLSRHPMSRADPTKWHFLVITTKNNIPKPVPLLQNMNGPRKLHDYATGCAQIFIEAELTDETFPVGSLPVELPDGGVLVCVDPEDVWEESVKTGIAELTPARPVVYDDNKPETLTDFVAAGEARLNRRSNIRQRWGFVADYVGRGVGSLRRIADATRALLGTEQDNRPSLYPGFMRNQLNASKGASKLLRSLLFWDTYLFWPAFGTFSAALLLPILWIAHADIIWVFVAYIGAFLLSTFGSRPCAASVSYGGTGLGGWAFAALFALSQSCVFARGFVAPDSSRLVNSIVGGLIGSRSKAIFAFSPALFVAALLLSSLAIVIAAFAMRGPLPKISVQKSPLSLLQAGKVVGFLILGTLPGALIAVELNLPKAFGDGAYAVSVVSGVVAGLAFFGSVVIAIGWKTRAIREALFHVILVALLVLVAGKATSHLLQVFFGCSATGILHGSIFTFVFLLTRQISKSPRLAVVAASLEGVLGFVGFAIAHIH